MPLHKLEFDGKEYYTMLDYDEITALLEFANTVYRPNSCFDYVEGIEKLVDGPYCVRIYVEPVGALGFWFNEVCPFGNWWGWYLEYPNGSCTGLNNDTEKWLEVVGNIWDNPELLIA